MSFKIGQKIREEAKRRGLTQKDLGKLINRHEKTVANIYKRVTIDTRLLSKIAAALGYDFFQHYYEEEPLRSLRQSEVKRLQDELQAAYANLERQRKELEREQRRAETLEENIKLMKQLAEKNK